MIRPKIQNSNEAFGDEMGKWILNYKELRGYGFVTLKKEDAKAVDLTRPLISYVTFFLIRIEIAFKFSFSSMSIFLEYVQKNII